MFNKKNLPLRSNETIVEIVRPSEAQHLFKLLLGFLIITLNAFFTFWLWQQGIEGRIFYACVWVLGIYLLLYGALFDHSNFLVVTSERVFDIHRESLFNETISSLSFTELSDVVVDKKGFFASLFNYGRLTLHPREGKFCFEIEKVPEPAKAQNLLFEWREQARLAGQLQDKEEVYKRFVKLLPEYSEVELTLLYEKVHRQLLELAKAIGKKP